MPKNAVREVYQAEREEPFSNKEMQAMVGVSLMSLHLWRQGTATKTAMPSKKLADGTVAYPVRPVLKWLKKHDIPLSVHPDDIGAKLRRARSKPGPIRAKHTDRRPVAYRH